MNYEKRIEQVIPKAVKIANGEVNRSDYKNPETYSAAWNKVYHNGMDRLCAEAGIRGSRKYKKAVTQH